MKRAKSKPKQLTNLASLDRTPIGRCQTSATADGNSERRTGAAAIASVPPNSRSVKAKPPAAVAHLASFFARASKNSLYYHTDGFLPGVTSFDNAESATRFHNFRFCIATKPGFASVKSFAGCIACAARAGCTMRFTINVAGRQWRKSGSYRITGGSCCMTAGNLISHTTRRNMPCAVRTFCGSWSTQMR